jgi:hypothetical protein
VFNGLIPPDYRETKYLPFADGFVIEGFVVDNRQFITKHWFTDNAWVNAINALMQNSQTKIAAVMVYGHPTAINQRLYALASYPYWKPIRPGVLCLWRCGLQPD